MSKAVKEKNRTLGRTVLPVVVMAVIALVLLVVLTLWKNSVEPAAPRLDAADAQFVVCIDPGHGGSDQGASWNGRLEKDDNLALALALQTALAERRIYAVLTRTGDETLSLEERVAFAEENGVDYFISLHRNLFEGQANGVEVWVARQCSQTAEDLARQVDEALVAVGVQQDRGVRRGSQDGTGDYYVLAHTSMPAILVEMGFMQDEEDNRLLDQRLNDYAAAMAEAILATWEETAA